FSSYFLFFFFQAEDGIRDFHVTGVQTCALPICARDRYDLYTKTTQLLQQRKQLGGFPALREENGDVRGAHDTEVAVDALHGVQRSEERRVGKEGGSGWAEYL